MKPQSQELVELCIRGLHIFGLLSSGIFLTGTILFASSNRILDFPSYVDGMVGISATHCQVGKWNISRL